MNLVQIAERKISVLFRQEHRRNVSAVIERNGIIDSCDTVRTGHAFADLLVFPAPEFNFRSLYRRIVAEFADYPEGTASDGVRDTLEGKVADYNIDGCAVKRVVFAGFFR